MFSVSVHLSLTKRELHCLLLFTNPTGMNIFVSDKELKRREKKMEILLDEALNSQREFIEAKKTNR